MSGFLSKNRREELKQLFRPFPGATEKEFTSVLPWEVWLLLNVPAYRTEENLRTFSERWARQYELILKGMGKYEGAPHLNRVDWAILLFAFGERSFTSKNPALAKALGTMCLTNKAFFAEMIFADKIVNYPWRVGRDCGPKNDVEAAYVRGLIESDGHVWKEVYKEGLAAERLSKREVEQQLNSKLCELGIRYNESQKCINAIGPKLTEGIEDTLAKMQENAKRKSGRYPKPTKKKLREDAELYDNYLKAKKNDPGLSYKQFFIDKYSEHYYSGHKDALLNKFRSQRQRRSRLNRQAKKKKRPTKARD